MARILFSVRALLPWLLALVAVQRLPAASGKPSIVYILCDDLGYGDVRYLNPRGKIPTPNMDRLGAAGMAFTDAHSSSAVCTPSRYSILTGRYNWRSWMKHGVLNGYSRRLIEPGRVTVAAFLKARGYDTACLGKWHLGMNWPQNDGTEPGHSANPKKIDYTRPIEGGPLTAGFDTFYGISASLDMVPYVFIQDDRVVEIPSVEKEWIRKGPAGPSFEAIDVLPTLTRKAVEYIGAHGPGARKDRPFFLYLPLTSPHTPILPTREWQGKSGLNPYADFVMQTDDAIGQVLKAIDDQGLREDTLVILASDNGCSPSADYATLLAKGHNPSHEFRGTKSDIWEGGHRVPFLVRWPARVAAGTTCDEPVCLSDFFATCADILGEKLADNMGEDSASLLPLLSGKGKTRVHEAIVHSAIFGAFSIRQGKWKLELCRDSGGWSDPKPGSEAARSLPRVQLYDLSVDVGETTNVEAAHPDVVANLTALLEKYIADGRSTPGQPQPNTGPVEVYSTRVGQPAKANPGAEEK